LKHGVFVRGVATTCGDRGQAREKISPRLNRNARWRDQGSWRPIMAPPKNERRSHVQVQSLSRRSRAHRPWRRFLRPCASAQGMVRSWLRPDQPLRQLQGFRSGSTPGRRIRHVRRAQIIHAALFRDVSLRAQCRPRRRQWNLPGLGDGSRAPEPMVRRRLVNLFERPPCKSKFSAAMNEPHEPRPDARPAKPN
jgi:hypothetical protein